MREFGQCGVAKMLRTYTDDFVLTLESFFALGLRQCRRQVFDDVAAFKEIFEEI